MTAFTQNRIGRRIILLVLVSVLLAVVASTGAFIWSQMQDNIGTRKAGIEATGYVFASAIADHVASGNRQEALKVLRSLTRVPDISYAVALDGQGHEIAALGNITLTRQDLANSDPSVFALLSRGSLPVAIDIVRAGQHVGRLVIVADVTQLRAQLSRALLVTLLSALASAVLGIAVAAKLQKRITAPILSLIKAMQHIGASRDYSTKVQHEADDETGILVDAFNRMISEIGFRDSALERQAYFDPLTGLANRQQFMRFLEDVLRETKSGEAGASLFLLDLDEFKQVNDTFGHTVGDAMLVSVAAILKQELPSDMLLARLGGDEFAIVAPGIGTESEAEAILARLLAAFLQPVHIVEREIFVNTSIGIVMIPRDGHQSEELLRRADLALYRAKKDGRGRVHFYRPALDEEVQLHTAIVHDLRRAMREGELETHYQAQVDLATGGVAGFESLIRWKHPIHGYVPPGKFIPAAEQSGLIGELGLWVLRDSCAQARRWADDGHPRRQIAVNVSAAQIWQGEFHREVEKILEETGLPPSYLCLELTESIFAGNRHNRVRYVLSALRNLGVTLALDDFGSGYSSLSYLQKLPFDKLKIDRAFVSGIEHDGDKRKLLDGMIDLSHALNLSVVAEGAETDGEVSLLRELGADQVQGYALSRPVPAPDAIAQAGRIAPDFLKRFPVATPRHLQKAG
jgi:diguanylate cyclase (GGDEF)-like protein